MNILIWFPLNVRGGGSRLFVNLVSALSRIKEIKKMKIVVSDECKNNEYLEGLSKIDGVSIYYYPEEIENILKKELEIIHPIDIKINELRSEVSTIETKISEIKKIIMSSEHQILNINITDIFYKKKSYALKYFEIVNSLKKKINKKQEELLEYEIQLNRIHKMIEELQKEKEKKIIEIKSKEESLKTTPVDYYGDDCDVVYYFWPHFIEFQKTTKPSVCTFHDVTIIDFPENVGGNNAKRFFENSQKWLSETTIIVTSSSYVKTRLLEIFNLKPDSIVVLPHRGNPVEYFMGRQQAEEIRRKYNLPEEYIVYPGNLGFHKNHYNLLIAFSRFKFKEKYPLVLFGVFTEFLRQAPPDYPELLNCARLVGLMARLKLRHTRDIYVLGYIPDEDVHELISNAKFLIMPSLSEGGGSYPVEEALRIGVPVACSDIPVMREHLSNRRGGIKWFDPESTESIAEAMNELIENYDEYKNQAMKGTNDPVQTWDEIAENYFRIFKMAIESFKNKSKNEA